MIGPEGAIPKTTQKERHQGNWDMEIYVGYILLVGVLLSLLLILTGSAWHWLNTGNLQFDYSLKGKNFFYFLYTDFQALIAGSWRPRLLVNLGVAALLLTPYLRVLVSILYFALVDHNWKYTAFTTFVFVVLTYSLFIR